MENKLKARLALIGMSPITLAKKIGVCSATFYRKMHTRTFYQQEISDISKILKLSKEDIYDIFFAK